MDYRVENNQNTVLVDIPLIRDKLENIVYKSSFGNAF